MTKRFGWLAPAVVTAALAALPAVAWDFKEEAKEPVKYTFAAGATTLDVDNVNGSVVVIGDTGNTMRVEGEKIVRANDKAELERGKKEVTLDTSLNGGVAKVYVNGPFRNRNGNGNSGDRKNTYEVTYNLTIRVPNASALHLRDVNGSVKADDISGALDVKTVNGSVTLNNVGGAGKIETVNGKMTASYQKNPTADSSFRTVNGKIDVTFQANLSANLKVKTLNGGAFTDFETTAMANPAPTRETRNGRHVIRMGDSRVLKVGNGGPELSFETVNGGIEIHKGK